MENKFYICIDLKSFFASVECVLRNLNPLNVNLVVADEERGKNTICLAITPKMKSLGIRNRCRLFEIPDNVEYIIAKPRMKKYMEFSAKIYSIYLKFAAPEDIHVYSIDECFIDITPYLKTYNKTPREFAKMLMEKVMEETGICATAGIGTNLFLAKLALDITAKNSPDCIGFLDTEEFKKSIWHHRPIEDIWNIGRGIAKRLKTYGVYDLYGVSKMPPETLYREFGINAEFLIDHARGIEPCTIADIQAYKTKSNSISNGQILFEDYNFDDALIVLSEMVDMLVMELISKHLVTNSISLSIGYSKNLIKPTGASRKLKNYTSSYNEIIEQFKKLYSETTPKDIPIRKINVGLNNVINEEYVSYQLDIFSNTEKTRKEKEMLKAMLKIKNKYGKNALLRGLSYQKKGTARKRNKLIGGHNGE